MTDQPTNIIRALSKSHFVESGYRAKKAGISKKDCPLMNRSIARRWWMQGYVKAIREQREDAR